jgi:hypothetical protein
MAKTATTLRARLRAAGVHLCISVAMGTTLLFGVLKVWYPSPLFELAAGKDLFLLVLGCDLTLGPLLTLVVFNTSKPRAELVRDLIVIGTVQLLALGYGVWTVLQVRPVFIVYNAGQFNVTLANEVVQVDGGEPVQALPWWGPRTVAVKLPDNADDRNRITFSSIEGRGDVFQMPAYFVLYSTAKDEVIRYARSPEELAEKLRLPTEVVVAAVREEMAGRRVGVLPLVVRRNVAVVAVSLDDARILGIETLPRTP